jgi:aryl-alcohol dehydrogenase-like predicted oxidoreductase
VGVVLVGFSTLDQLEEAASASTGQQLTESELAGIEDLYRTDFALRQPV